VIYEAIFFKLLGIPNRKTEPTPYDLLDLDPRTFSPAQVPDQLGERKRRLRQNIPGPQFIPVVTLWERELDLAAEVLTDPAKRAAYHDQLNRESSEASSRNRRQQRERVILDVRKFLASIVDSNGALSKSKRPAAAARLRELGLDAGQAAAVLDRIPLPAARAAEPSAEAIDYFTAAAERATCHGFLLKADRRELSTLAAKLFIPGERAAAIVQEEVARAKARGGPAGASSQGISLDGTDSYEEFQDQRERSAVRAMLAPRRRRSSFLVVLVPVLAIGVFVLLALHFGRGDTSKPEHSDRLPVQAPPTQPWTLRPKPDVDPGPDRRPPEEPWRPRATGTAPVEAYGQVAESVKTSYGDTRASGDLLTDVAVTLLACRDCAVEFATRTRGQFRSLRTALGEPTHADRADYLTADVTLLLLAEGNGEEDGGGALTPERLRALGRRVTSGAKGPRYQAIEELCRADTAEAADVLLKDVVERVHRTKKPVPVVHRVLRGLSRMSAPEIPKELLALLVDCRKKPAYAQAVVRTLIAGSNIPVGPQSNGKVPLGEPQYMACVKWWNQVIARPDFVWGKAKPAAGAAPARNGPVPPLPGAAALAPEPGAAAAWTPDPVPPKLLAVVAEYVRLTGKALEPVGWDPVTLLPVTSARALSPRGVRGIEPEADVLELRVRSAEVGSDLTGALSGLVAELERLIRAHPDGADRAARADAVRLGMEGRRLACRTRLQEAVVILDAAWELLAILAEQIDRQGELAAGLAVIRRDREEALVTSGNVLKELRESAYYNLALWEMILQKRQLSARAQAWDDAS